MSYTGRDDAFLNTEITNDGFFPNLVIGDLQKTYRIPASAPEETVTHQLKLAVARVNEELKAFKCDWIAQGYNTLALAEESPANDGKKLADLYKMAVYSFAKAELLEDFETFTRRDIADNIANQEEKVWQGVKANGRWAVNVLKGLTKNVSVELL